MKRWIHCSSNYTDVQNTVLNQIKHDSQTPSAEGLTSYSSFKQWITSTKTGKNLSDSDIRFWYEFYCEELWGVSDPSFIFD